MQPVRALRGSVRVPGDKSISHRYALLAALADGVTTVGGYSSGADCASTLDCLRALGVAVVEPDAGTRRITGRGLGGLQPPAGPLDCGNSGSTMRMLAGILAAHRFATVLTGDASLSRRPMGRVMAPLIQMGARLTATDGQRPPLTVQGAALTAIAHTPAVPSAQVKTAVLLAGLHANGRTSVHEPAATRDHTERALRTFGVPVDVAGTSVSITGGARLRGGLTLTVPGDPSSAAFWAVAAASRPGSRVEITGLGLNPTRTGFLDVLRRAGARLTVMPQHDTADEPVGTLVIEPDTLRAVDVAPDEVPGVIDELPVLAALATAGGAITVRGAAELRVKESDRIASLVGGLRAMGASAEEYPDGFHIDGRRPLTGGTVDAHGDHRLAMAFAVAGLSATGPTTILGAEAVAVSYPTFFETLRQLHA